MSVSYIIKLKLWAFRRKFFPKNRFFDFLFARIERYSIKSILAIHEDFEIENADKEFLNAPYLMSRGKYEAYIFLFILAVLCVCVDFFPMEISDAGIHLFHFLWDNPIIFLLLFPLFICCVLIVIPQTWGESLHDVSFYSSFFIFFFSLLLLGRFDLSAEEFQFQFRFKWDYEDTVSFFDFVLGLDGLSLVLVVLTSFLFLICFLLARHSNFLFVKEFYIAFFILFVFILLAFTALDLILFYIAFEATLVPLFIIIGVWGARERKIYAAYKLFFYTLASSICTLIGLAIIIFSSSSGDLTSLINLPFSNNLQKTLWVLLFLSFAVKLPMIPVHIWLPEAHVEAPTSGSIILAAILLKLGGYGFFRFLVPLCPQATVFFSPLLAFLSCAAIVYASLLALRQIDLKKLIAYSSIAHMGFVSLSLVSINFASLSGGIFIMLSHGFISGALFACIGVLYDRYKTKLIFYYQSLTTVMPLFSSIFFFFVLANIGLPGTSSFIGEFSVLVGLFNQSNFLTFLAGTGIIFGAVYSLWMFNRIFFGHLSTKYIAFYADLTANEFIVLFSLLLPVLFFGLFPFFIIDYFSFFIDKLSCLAFFN